MILGGEHEQSGKMNLREGRHQFTLVYWQGTGVAKLVMEAAGPGGEFGVVIPDSLSRVEDDAEIGPSEGMDDDNYRQPEQIENPQPGVSYEIRDLGDSTITSAGELRGLPQSSKGNQTQLDLSMKHPEKNFAVIFRGFFNIQAEGEYRAKLTSTGSSQLFFGPTPAVLLPISKEPKQSEWRVKLRHQGNIEGDLKSWEADSCVIECQLGDQPTNLSVPTTNLTELWPTKTDLDELKSDREDEPTDQDSVYAKSKSGRFQRVSGTVLGIADEALRFEYKGKERTIALERVVGIVMRKSEAVAAAVDVAPHRLEFLGGASLPGRLTGIDSDTLTLTLPWGDSIQPRRSDIRRIVIAQGRFQSLSTLKPSEIKQTSFFDRILPMAIDESLTGGTLQIGDKTYDRGLCLHSKSVISYELSGEYTRFRCGLGLQENDGDAGNVAVKVMADDELLLDVAELTGADEVRELDLDVTGKDRLTLTVDFGKNLHIGDHLVLANAHLLRGEETP